MVWGQKDGGSLVVVVVMVQIAGIMTCIGAHWRRSGKHAKTALEQLTQHYA